MNFNRFQCQKYIEFKLGCSDYTALGDYKEQFIMYSLSHADVHEFEKKAKEDAKDLYYKALVTFLDATSGMHRGQSSWPIVKLYYSLFYSLRVFILCSGYVILKSGTRDIYGIKILAGEKPTKITTNKISGDHKATIHYFKKLFASSEAINGNTIDGKHVFDWIMSYRELVNYRINSFIEPEYGYNVMPNIFKPESSYDYIVSEYINEADIAYCFAENHSIYATPILMLKKARDKIAEKCNEEEIMSEDRINAAKRIIADMNLEKSTFLNSLLFK